MGTLVIGTITEVGHDLIFTSEGSKLFAGQTHFIFMKKSTPCMLLIHFIDQNYFLQIEFAVEL